MELLKVNPRQEPDVTSARCISGFASDSHLSEQAVRQSATVPRKSRDHGHGLVISCATVQTPLGLILVGVADRGICFLHFGATQGALLALLKQKYSAAVLTAMTDSPSEKYKGWLQSLRSYLAGETASGNLPVALHGTAFQQMVWRYLQTIPSGQVKTYTEVAGAIGRPNAVRAVASACARNPVALLVPCHRVLRGDGGLGGYKWGLDRKQALLAAERHQRESKALSPSARLTG